MSADEIEAEPGPWLGEPLEMGHGVARVGVSQPHELARTGGRAVVYLNLQVGRPDPGSVAEMRLTGAEARELAGRLVEAADLCP